MTTLKCVAISDTHNYHGAIDVPEADVIIHSGDATSRGYLHEIENFARWFGSLPHKHKIFVAGNHDIGFEARPEESQAAIRARGITYLQDREITIDGVKFYGSPWQPRFYDWAFNLDRGEPLRQVWSKIPDDVDVLITHGPPIHLLDVSSRGEPIGCEDLAARIRQVKPEFHVFGHNHYGYGMTRDKQGVTYINASICTEAYRPTNQPICFEVKCPEV